MWIIVGLLLLGTSSTGGLYSSNDDVIKLTSSNFNKSVLKSNRFWLIQFYAPWCGHCQQLAPEWKKVASDLKGIIKVGAIDVDQHQTVASQYDVSGFPSIKIFGFDKQKPRDFTGGRDASIIVDQALKALDGMVRERQSKRKKKDGEGYDYEISDDVVSLTDSNFKKLVLDSNETWFVQFYAPWCGHCKNLAPRWIAAATEVKEKTGGTVKLGALDATMYKEASKQYKIEGYPSIKIFRKDYKSESPIDYEGRRDVSSIVDAALEFSDEIIEAPSVDELVSSDVFEEKCSSRLCVIAFLPDLADSKKEGRNQYLELLRTLGENFKKQKWGWLWSSATVQSELEQQLQVGGFGYPAVVAINQRKELYALYRGSFSDKGLRPFLSVLTYGRGKFDTVPLSPDKKLKIVATDRWDGEDTSEEQVEDVDLSDFKWEDEL